MSDSDHDEAPRSGPWLAHHWPMLLFITIGVAAMGLLLAALIGFMTWKSSPQKVLLDVANNALTTPGTYKIVSGQDTVTVRNDGTLQSIAGIYQQIAFESVLSGSTVYIKSSTPDRLVNLFVPTQTADPVVKKAIDDIQITIKDRWIGVSLQELTQSPATALIPCSVDSGNQLTTNKDAFPELAKTYLLDQFLAIKQIAAASDTTTYELTVDQPKFRTFVNGLERTRLYKSQAENCASVLKTAKSDDFSKLKANVTVKNADNTLSSLFLQDGTGKTTTAVADYQPVAKLAIPDNVLWYTDLKSSVSRQIFMSMFSAR